MAFKPTVWAPLAIILLYISTTVVTKLRKHRKNIRLAKEKGCLPPRVQLPPVVFPFILIKLFEFKRAFDEKRHINFVYDQFLEYGPTRVYKSALSGPAVIITCDPENIKTVLATSFHDFELGKARHEAFAELLGDGIFTTDGKAWEHARALLRPQFTKDQIADLDDLEIHFQNLLAVLSPQEGKEVKLHKLFLNFSLDSATSFLFGRSVYSLRNKIQGPDELVSEADRQENKQFEEDFDYTQDALGFRLGIWDLRLFYHPRRLPGAIANIHHFVDKLIGEAIQRTQEEKAVKGNHGKYVFLEALIQDTQDPIVLRDQLLSAMLAGRDTTATLLSWTFWLLSKNQRVWVKLREEVLAEVGQGKPTYQQLKDCRYLKWVLNETLRVYPILPINFRMCNKNTTLPVGGGPDGRSPIFVEEGARIVYSVYALHRRKDIYGEDADEFRPERWGDGKGRGWEYLPFNGGPRICIGQQMALVTASYVIVRLLQIFDRIEDADLDQSGEIRTNLSLTLSPANGTPVRLYKAQDS